MKSKVEPRTSAIPTGTEDIRLRLVEREVPRFPSLNLSIDVPTGRDGLYPDRRPTVPQPSNASGAASFVWSHVPASHEATTRV